MTTLRGSPSTLAVALGLALQLATACGDDALTRVRPRLEVDPERLDFGAAVVGRDAVLPLALLNRGSGPLELEGVEVEPAGGVFGVGEAPTGLPGSARATLAVTFNPRRAREVYAGVLRIRSDDPARPVLEVPLEGVGGVREIEVSPAEIDFGVVNEGTAPRRAVEVRNVGGDPLHVSVVFETASVDLALAPGGGTSRVIEAGTSTVVELVYSPVDLGADEGVLVLTSDDEDEPEVRVPVRGQANLAPRAVAWACDKEGAQVGCDGRRPRRRVGVGLRNLVGVDGRESFDPEGGALVAYRWVAVEWPTPARPSIFQGNADRTERRGATGDFQVPQVGRYVFRLVATDERGLDSLDLEASRVVLEPRDLEVRLRWDVGTDVDLHFVRPGGREGDYGSGRVGTSTGSDCSPLNRQPNWGDPSTPDDDPRLDKDDITGTGPEVVSLDDPEPGGAYRLLAHYCDSRRVNVNTYVTAEVLVRGQVVSVIPVMDGVRMLPGQLWEAARLVWDPATDAVRVEPVAAPLTARPELCLAR